MEANVEEIFRQAARNPKTSLTIRGYGSLTVDGFLDEPEATSIAELLAKQEPTRRVIEFLAALVATQPPTGARLRTFCEILAQTAPTEELLRLLADLVAEANPHIYSLVDGQRPTKSTLKTLTNLVAQQIPSKRIMQILARSLGTEPPSRQLQEALANLVRANTANSESKESGPKGTTRDAAKDGSRE